MQKSATRKSRDLQPEYDLFDLKNVHAGSKCFICGAGPSIGFLKLDEIHKHVVISVNSSILLMSWKNGDTKNRYWVSNDSLCMKWDYFWKYVLRSKCNKIVRTSWYRQDDRLRGHNFRYFKPRLSQNPPLSNDGSRLCKVSSVPTAIDLAILMGCKNIYLLGVDHKLLQGKSHFWQFFSASQMPQRIDKMGVYYVPDVYQQLQTFSENIPVYRSLQELSKRSGSNIYNCSYRSAVDVFEKISLEKALTENE
jgi:hypothetical protein